MLYTHSTANQTISHTFCIQNFGVGWGFEILSINSNKGAVEFDGFSFQRFEKIYWIAYLGLNIKINNFSLGSSNHIYDI